MLGIDLAYAQVAAALPTSEADMLRVQHAAWAQEIAAMCGLQSTAISNREIDDSLSSCLGDHFQDWREWLDGYRHRIGRLDIFTRSIRQWSRDQYYEVRIDYPQISGPTLPGERAFNDSAVAAPRS